MGIGSKMVVGFVGLMVLGAISGGNSNGSRPSSASAGPVTSLQDVASTYTNNIHSSACHVTFNSFDQLQSGMSYASAVSTLGCPGREESRSDMAGYTTVMYGWDGAGAIGANMNAMFQNGQLVNKAQFGLH